MRISKHVVVSKSLSLSELPLMCQALLTLILTTFEAHTSRIFSLRWRNGDLENCLKLHSCYKAESQLSQDWIKGFYPHDCPLHYLESRGPEYPAVSSVEGLTCAAPQFLKCTHGLSLFLTEHCLSWSQSRTNWWQFYQCSAQSCSKLDLHSLDCTNWVSMPGSLFLSVLRWPLVPKTLSGVL